MSESEGGSVIAVSDDSDARICIGMVRKLLENYDKEKLAGQKPNPKKYRKDLFEIVRYD